MNVLLVWLGIGALFLIPFLAVSVFMVLQHRKKKGE